MKTIWIFIAGVLPLLFVCPAPGLTQEDEPSVTHVGPQSDSLEQDRINELEKRLSEMEMQLLRLEAGVEPEADMEDLKPVQFQGKARALQMLNPELSAGIEMFGALVYKDGKYYAETDYFGLQDPDETMRSGFFVREAAFHVQSTLDPFSMVKIAFALEGGHAHLEEAYIVYNSIAHRLGLTVGKFRQPLGVVNRWHRHSLDQFDYPLMLKIPFGPEGLAQTGVSLNWLMPSWWAHAQELVIQITSSENDGMFAGEFFSIPSGLLRLKSYWDLNRDTYLELGLTGLIGFGHRSDWAEVDGEAPAAPASRVESGRSAGGVTEMADEPVRISWAVAADLTLNWEPLHKSKYRGVVWRTEFLYAQRDTNMGNEDFWGGYSYLEGKIARSLFFGLRADLIRDFEPVAEDNHKFTYQFSPYLTWWQSEFVRFRLQYDALNAHGEPLEHRVILQVECAAGPHKHERY